MTKAKITDIRALSDDQLAKRQKELHKEQFNLRVQKATGQLEKTSAVRNARRELAQLKTIATERALGLNETKAAKSAEKKTTKTKKESAAKK